MTKDEQREYNRQYYIKNREKMLAKATVYRDENREAINAAHKERYATDPERAQRVRDNAHQWYITNSERARAFRQEYGKRIGARLFRNAYSRIIVAMKKHKLPAHCATWEALNCDLETLMAHLEQNFVDGMSWENYGEWEMDHIKPCISFDLTDKAQFMLCFHYSNLQPMWALENMQKGYRERVAARLEKEQQTMKAMK